MRRASPVRFLIANAGHARWVRRGEHGFQTLGEILPRRIHHPSHPQVTVHESATSGRHAAGDTDEASRRRIEFAAEIADEINQHAREGAFERLAVVAPARFLGALRPHLSHETTAKLVREIPKDLTKVADHDLGEWLTAPDLA